MLSVKGTYAWGRPFVFWLATACVWFIMAYGAAADTFHGINAGAVIWNGSIQLTQQKASAIAATGTNAIRVNFRLDGNVTWNASILSQYDQIISNANNAGLEVLGLWSNETVYGGQSVWNDDPDGDGMNSYVSSFTQNASILTNRYKETIKTWEVWNEPNAWASANPAYNDPRYVGGTYILPSVYANILAETYKELNYYNGASVLDDNNIRLMTGGLFAHEIGGSYSHQMDYMQQVYDQTAVWSGFQADTGRTYAWDLFGYHFYLDQGGPVNIYGYHGLEDYLNEVRSTQAANGDTSDVSITEWGWETINGNTQELQRDNMAATYDFLEGLSYMDSTYWYQWSDEPLHNLGIVTTNGTPKLSHAEFSARNAFIPGIPGDFDLDDDIDADDIDLLFDNFGNAGYDLTGDGATNNLDAFHLIRVILNTEYGDADLDGDVDIDDFNQLSLAFGTNAGWAGGDFTGNNIVNDSDVTVLKLHFGFQAPPQGTPIPEPASAGILALLALLTTLQRHN